MTDALDAGRVLVTGGGGFLGGAIVRGLRERGLTVRSMARNHYPLLDTLGVEQLRGDVADAAAVDAAVAGCDVVFHVAARAGIWGSFDDFYRVNVGGTENVIAACRRHGVDRLVYTSSPSVVFNGRDMEGVDESVPYPGHYTACYPHTKALAEQRTRAANDARLATVCLRPHLIWGPGDNHLLPRLLGRARRGQLRRVGPGTKRVDTVYIDNAAAAHLLAAERLHPGSTVAGKVYFISNGDPRPLWDMINALLDAAGLPAVHASVPVPVAMLIAGVLEGLYRLTGAQGEPRLTRFVVQELATAHWFDIGAARRELGYIPVVSIAEGMARLRLAMQSAPPGSANP